LLSISALPARRIGVCAAVFRHPQQALGLAEVARQVRREHALGAVLAERQRCGGGRQRRRLPVAADDHADAQTRRQRQPRQQPVEPERPR
jgi:hypothetical protein